jgi:hypothetical protein
VAISTKGAEPLAPTSAASCNRCPLPARVVREPPEPARDEGAGIENRHHQARRAPGRPVRYAALAAAFTKTGQPARRPGTDSTLPLPTPARPEGPPLRVLLCCRHALRQRAALRPATRGYGGRADVLRLGAPRADRHAPFPRNGGPSATVGSRLVLT